MIPESDILLKLVDLLIIIIFISYSYRTFGKNMRAPRNLWMEFLIIVFCVFSTWGGDWFHYREIFNIGVENSHLEEIHGVIMGFFNNYLVYRFFYWGFGFLLIKYAYQHLQLDYSTTLLLFGLSSLIWFSYARVSLAMALIFTGFVLIATLPKFNIFKICIGLLLIASAFYFHRSAVFFIVVAVLALLASRLKARMIPYMMIISLPLIVLLFRGSFIGFMNDMAMEDGSLGEYSVAGMHYIDMGHYGYASKAAWILDIIEKIPYYISAVLSIIVLRGNNGTDKRIVIYSVALLNFFVVFFASIFSFDIGGSTYTLYVRFLRFAIIPMIAVVSYCLCNNLSHKLTNAFLLSAGLSSFSMVLYSVYCSI